MPAVSTLEKLVSLQQRRVHVVDVAAKDSSVSQNADAESVASNQVTTVSLREACLKEQLESMYSDLEYLSKSFPGHTVRSLVDLARNSGLMPAPEAPLAVAEIVTPPDSGIVPGTLLAALDKAPGASIDHGDLGIVEVDESGRLISMNPSAWNAIGMTQQDGAAGNFFTEVVPGANNSIFYGRFLLGRQDSVFDVEFNYAFAYRTSPTLCTVHMLKTPKLGRYFIFLRKIEG